MDVLEVIESSEGRSSPRPKFPLPHACTPKHAHTRPTVSTGSYTLAWAPALTHKRVRGFRARPHALSSAGYYRRVPLL